MMDLHYLLILVITAKVGHCEPTNDKTRQRPTNDDEIRDMLGGILTNYDAKLRPNYLGKPVEVVVDTTVLSISNIDEVHVFIRTILYEYRGSKS